MPSILTGESDITFASIPACVFHMVKFDSEIGVGADWTVSVEYVDTDADLGVFDPAKASGG
jgi:hypothetical protein